MTNDPTENQKSNQQPATSEIDNIQPIKQLKIDLCTISTSTSSDNLMKFIESIPSDSSPEPCPRSGHRAIATESDLWIWGGYFPATNHRSERMFQEVKFRNENRILARGPCEELDLMEEKRDF